MQNSLFLFTFLRSVKEGSHNFTTVKKLNYVSSTFTTENSDIHHSREFLSHIYTAQLRITVLASLNYIEVEREGLGVSHTLSQSQRRPPPRYSIGGR